MRQGVLLTILLLLVGCAPGAAQPAVTPAQQAEAPETLPSATFTAVRVTETPAPSPTALPSATPTRALPTATATPAAAVCSPLEGIQVEELGQPDLLKTLFQAPRPGQDDGHHGADFAFWSRGDRKSMLGLPIHSVLAGQVVGIIPNRPPYGYAVIIETTLEQLPPGWQDPLPTPAPTIMPATNLFCPPDPTQYANRPGRSLYLLYAHMNQPPVVTLGQAVSCGQVIGEVGTTGKSVNAHLHLETRVGPSGAVFEEMAHYDNAATEGEMRTYCTWRVSGLFQMLDPMDLLSLQP